MKSWVPLPGLLGIVRLAQDSGRAQCLSGNSAARRATKAPIRVPCKGDRSETFRLKIIKKFGPPTPWDV
jgi:hypothetical protein